MKLLKKISAFFKRKPKVPKKTFVKIGNRLVEFVEPPTHIPAEKMEAMRLRARDLKIKYPTMSLERIQRKVCEEFHITIDKDQSVERVGVDGSGALIRKIERKP